MVCNWKGCDRTVLAIGLCSRHYNRLRTTGTCEDSPKARAPFAARLWRQIDKRGPDECWPWTSKTRLSGYGVIKRGGRDTPRVVAHRAVWELTFGPIPSGTGHHGTILMHTCDNRLCCNPAHLRLGTQADNVRDMDNKGRRRTVALKGEAHARSKHTEAQVRAIKRDKGPPSEVAKRHGVPVHLVKNIRYGKAWRHVE